MSEGSDDFCSKVQMENTMYRIKLAEMDSKLADVIRYYKDEAYIHKKNCVFLCIASLATGWISMIFIQQLYFNR